MTWLRDALDDDFANHTGDLAAATAVRTRADTVLRPLGALARFDELAVWMAHWRRTLAPAVERPHCLVFAGDHGVAAAGVSAYPADVTVAMRTAIEQGKATINALGRAAGCTVDVIDVGVAEPTADWRFEPAMTSERFDAVCVTAADAVAALADERDTDLLVVGELGIGNTTTAAAICACLWGGDASSWVGSGTGVDADGLARKVAAVTAAQARLRTDGVRDPLEVLRHVGGTELVAMAAAVVAARQRGIPVLLDGYVVGAAVAPIHAVRADALDHCRAAHVSAEPGHEQLLRRIGLDPLLSLQMRLGEASGAMAAVPMVRMACAAVVEVPTFGEWFG